MARKTYEERLSGSSNLLLRKLLDIMIKKNSNLCVSADFKNFRQVIDLVEKIGRHICILKIHSESFGLNNIEENLELLYKLKLEYNFLLFEDRKFYDGKAIVQNMYEPYAKYVDLVTVVPIFGDGIFKAIEDGIKNARLPESEPRGCLAVCELSFSGLILPESTNSWFERLLEAAEKHTPICAGIIAQKLNVHDEFSMFKASPGAHLERSSDGSNQQWRTPDQVINDGADVVIVGRGIISASPDEWEPLTIRYKERLYKAYLDATKQ